MPNARKSVTDRHRAAPVAVRHVLPDLSPRMRRLALLMAGGDPSKVHVIRPGHFEVIDPVTTEVPAP